jgi:LuxR family transcriptional regulator, maltose regulon positive regulatory protein
MSADTRAPPILASKLYPASGTRRPVTRPRLDASLDALEDSYRVVALVAPAGYGKSTLMTRWHEHLTGRGIACAWVSMDEDDNDATRFMRYLLAALQQVDGRIGREFASQQVADFADGSRPLLETLAADLARLQHRTVLFLDDLQFVDEPEVLKALDWLVNYAPSVFQIVIGSREEPRLRLSTLRIRRQLFEIGVDQLQFDAEEAVQFCRSRLGRDLTGQDLQKLLRKTEGWPAALELVTMALADPARQTAFIEHFAGTDSTLVDYLGEVVLSRLDPRTRAFVFRISMFDRMCAPLAAALGEPDDAEELLQALRLRNLFLIPLDPSASWVRFHHLVGEFFRERYRRMLPEQARDCLIRGAHWMHANGNLEEAVNCMIRAQDWEQATKWVAESVEELVFRRGYHQTILRWMKALPEACVDRYPVIRIQYAFALSFYSRHREHEAQIYRLQQLLQSLVARSHHDAAVIDELRCAVELQTAMAAGLRDEGMRGGELAAAWLAGWPQASLRRKGVMGNVLAFGHKSTAAIAQGLEVIDETRKWLEQADGFYALAWTAYLEAVLHLKRGSYLEARLACNNGLELVERELHGHPAHASLCHALLAGIAYEFNDIRRANEHIELAMNGVNEYGHADAVIVAYLTQARLQRLRDDEDSALAILREGQELGERRALRRVTITLAAEECCGLARAGRHEEARLVATRFAFNELPVASDVSDLFSDKSLRAASRYLLQQSPKLVVRTLSGAIERTQRLNLAHRQVELLLLRALARKHDGDWSGALTDLADAVLIAAPRQYLRVFLDEGPELGAVLQRLEPERLRGSEAAPLARRLQQEMTKSDAPGGHRVAANAEEALTKREVSILKRLDSGLSNREIAEAIFVSEGTLKWHLHNVYSKLSVRNRTGAMARARALGII